MWFATAVILPLALFSIDASAQEACKAALEKQEVKEKKEPGSYQQTSAGIVMRMARVLKKFPNQTRLVDEVATRFADPRIGAQLNGHTKVLVVSTSGLDPQGVLDLQNAIAEMTGKSFVSFPLEEGGPHFGEHLYSRPGGMTLYDFDFRWGAGGEAHPENYRMLLFQNQYPYYLNAHMGRNILEPVLALSNAEMKRLNTYVKNVSANVEGVLGRFNINGALQTNGNLEKNIPGRGAGHNCTSWIMNSPIADGGKSLVSLIGPQSPYNGYIVTNPGWMLAHFVTESDPVRVPVTIMWTRQPVEQTAQGLSETGLVNWNFNPK